MRKTLLTTFVMIAVILAIVVQTFAFSAVSTGDVLSEGKSLEEQLAELSPERQAELLAKVNRQRDYSFNQVTRTISSWDIIDDFNGYTQESDIYCVIACCQSVIHCVANIYYTQSQIAENIGLNSDGVPFGNALTYLNDYQDAWTFYHETSISTYNNVMSDFLFAIGSDVPVVMSTIFSKSDGWIYTTSLGHTMVAYGIKSDASEIAISDPYLVRLSNKYDYDEYEYTTPYYDMDSVLVYDAIVERGNGYIY